jgi:hypothetical protein
VASGKSSQWKSGKDDLEEGEGTNCRRRALPVEEPQEVQGCQAREVKIALIYVAITFTVLIVGFSAWVIGL